MVGWSQNFNSATQKPNAEQQHIHERCVESDELSEGQSKWCLRSGVARKWGEGHSLKFYAPPLPGIFSSETVLICLREFYRVSGEINEHVIQNAQNLLHSSVM